MCFQTQMVIRNPEDFYSSDCRGCGGEVEFFADDLMQNCADCGTLHYNPRMTDEWDERLKTRMAS